MIPSRGAWLEFEVDKKGLVGVRIDRKRKQSVTVFLRAIGLSEEEIRAEFAGFETIMDTLAKDDAKIQTQEEALRDIYRKLRPGEQVASEAARALLDNYYFNRKRYDLAKVGRYKLNRKLGLERRYPTPSSRSRTSSRSSATSSLSSAATRRSKAPATVARSRTSRSRLTTSTLR